MDRIFTLFENWYQSKENEWNMKGLHIDRVSLSTHAHQYHLDLSSDSGLGRISLYESNSYYWVDFEAGNYNYDAMFLRGNITFTGEESLQIQEREFVEYILWNNV